MRRVNIDAYANGDNSYRLSQMKVYQTPNLIKLLESTVSLTDDTSEASSADNQAINLI